MICRLRFHICSNLAVACVLLGACERSEVDSSEMAKARIELARGDAHSARLHLDHVRQQGLPAQELVVDFAEAALLDGDFETAREWLESADFSQGSRAHGFLLLGRVEMADNNLAAAGQAFDQSYRSAPDNPDLWVEIGRLRYRGGEQLQAVQAVNRALEIDPVNREALLFRAQLVRDALGMKTAARILGDAVEIHPDDVDLRVELAATLGDGGYAAEALRVLRGNDGEAVSTPRGIFVQAVLAARGGSFRLARDLLARSMLVEEGMASAQILSAIIDLQDENYANAVLTLDRLYAVQPDNQRVRDLLAYGLLRSGSEQELVRRFAKAASARGASAYLRTLVGRAYEALGDRHRAAVFLDLAAAQYAGLVPLYMVETVKNASGPDGMIGIQTRDFVRNAIASGDTISGVERARDFARRFPGSADALALLGDAELVQGNRTAARDAYEKSAQIRRSWVLIERMMRVSNSPSDARRIIESYVREHPMNGEAAATLADGFAAEGEWERAVLLLDHAMKSGMARVPWVVAARSIAADRLGDRPGATFYALAAYQLQPMSPHAVSALIAVLPDGDAKREELEAKLRSLTMR